MSIIRFLRDKKENIVFPRTIVDAIKNNEGKPLQDILDELFTSVSNGKASVASAITDKGVTTAQDATFAQMAANILSIEGSGSGGSSGGGGGLPTGIAEIAYGVFTPTTKGPGVSPIIGQGGLPNTRAFLVEHGMSGVPDGYIAIPSVWYDTQDSQLLASVYFKGIARMCYGRRSVSSDTTWGGNDKLTAESDGGASLYGDETYINLYGGSFAQFCPTWDDGNGNTGAQEYKWIAWRFA